MRELACVLSVAPAGIIPTAPPPAAPGFAAAPGFVVAVLPVRVVVVVGAGAGLFSARVTGPLCAGRCVTRGCVRGSERLLGAGAAVAGAFAGTSLSCGCAVVSRFA